MSSATLTLIGLYQYDNDLFTELDLPEGIDTDLLIDSILMRGGEYEVIYPNAGLMRHLIGSWSKQWFDTFYNWLRATNEMKEIEPLDNYNRHEEWTDDSVNNSESTDVMTGKGSTTGTDSSHGTGSVSNDTTDTSKISADDVDNFVNKTQDIINNSQSNTTDTSSNTSTQSNTSTNSHATNNATNNQKHNGHIWGNIGVTTSAQMYSEFYDTMLRYGNIYDCISTVFCNNFVIPIL